MTPVPVAWLRDAIARIFGALGFAPRHAELIAEPLVDADLRGLGSHGAMLVPLYVTRLRAGAVSMRTEADMAVDAPALAVLDAGHALGQLTSPAAVDLAVERARATGVGLVLVRRAHHFGAAGYWARRAVDAGCVGLAACNTTPLMPAPGGRARVVGNNPLAIAAPSADGAPLVLDMATSVTALQTIRLAAARGERLPDDVALDADGRPTTDPAAALAGMLLPAAGAKGFGLALMLDVLAGGLSGGAMGDAVRSLHREPDAPNDCAHLFLAIDPDITVGREALSARAGALAAAVRRSGGRTPGERRPSGVRLEPDVLAGLRRAAADVGVQLAAP